MVYVLLSTRLYLYNEQLKHERSKNIVIVPLISTTYPDWSIKRLGNENFAPQRVLVEADLVDDHVLKLDRSVWKLITWH